jgi:hypothetical protein
VDQHHLEKALNQLESGMPSQSGKEQLENLIQFVAPSKDDFIAPTPEQIDAFLTSVREAVAEWDDILQPPGSDRIFVDGDAEGRQLLKDRLHKVRSDIQCIVDGVTAIEKKPHGARKQKRRFNALEARQDPPPAIVSRPST